MAKRLRTLDKSADILRFSSDGWQARYDKSFTKENIVRLADALGHVWSDEQPGATVIVGFDTRAQSSEYARLVAQVIAAHGLEVRVSDRFCPTPAVGFACATSDDAVGGIIITATELSCEYNGIVVRDYNGGPVSRGFLDVVEHQIPLKPTEARGNYQTINLMIPYLETLLSEVDVETITSSRLRVVVDPMYGAASGYVAELLRAAGCSVREIHAGPQDDFGGIHPQPADPWADECSSVVQETGADLGVLFDGDGDRAAIVDGSGHLLTPHEFVPLVIKHLVAFRGEKGRVISTITCSARISRQAECLGLESVSVPVGFARIYSEIEAGDVLLAAEEYGGMCFPHHLHERDGLLAALYIVEMVAKSEKSIAELIAEDTLELGRMCYMRRGVRLDAAATQAFRNILPGLNPADVAGYEPVSVSHADGLRLQFADNSWVLIRPSRMDALVRVYAEASTEAQRDKLLDAACEIVRREA